MAEPRFLAVHSDAADVAALEIERERIEGAGGALRATRARDEDELIVNLRDADVVLVSAAQITRRVIEQLDRCRLIIRYGVGLDTLDIPAATDHGIVVAHFPDFCQPEVANQAVMLLLACAKQLIPLDQAVRDGRWRSAPLSGMPHLTGQTLGLVAFGNIAREVARRAVGFDLEVLAYDPYVPDAEFAVRGVERVATLAELLARSDFVSLHTPLTPETRHMISTAQFTGMKRSAFLINTSRGPVVDEAALVDALRDGEIAGAGLDVFEHEPLTVGSPLAGMDNVALTPHSASYSDRAFTRLKERVGQTCVDFFMHERWPEFAANRDAVAPRTALH